MADNGGFSAWRREPAHFTSILDTLIELPFLIYHILGVL